MELLDFIYFPFFTIGTHLKYMIPDIKKAMSNPKYKLNFKIDERIIATNIGTQAIRALA